MNNYTLESFISFCDDMMITNESFNFTKIKDTFIRALKTILNKITELILKFTKNKNVEVSSDFCDKYADAEKFIEEFGKEITNKAGMSVDIDDSALKQAHKCLTELKSISVEPTTKYGIGYFNTYTMFKDMNMFKRTVQDKITFWNKHGDKDDLFDKAEYEADLKYFQYYVDLYETVYSKIKYLK